MILFINDVGEEDLLGKNIRNEIIKGLHIRDEIREYNEYENEIQSCEGCFQCWVKTPGLCAIHDDAREINKLTIESDVFLLLSKVRYGCYSTYIKRIIDRSIPNRLPFFRVDKYEVHLEQRYSKYPAFIVIGYGDDIDADEEITFRKLIRANAINLKASVYRGYIIKNKKSIFSVIEDIKRTV